MTAETGKRFALSWRERVRIAALESTIEIFKCPGVSAIRHADKPAEIFEKTTRFAEQIERWIMDAEAATAFEHTSYLADARPDRGDAIAYAAMARGRRREAGKVADIMATAAAKAAEAADARIQEFIGRTMPPAKAADKPVFDVAREKAEAADKAEAAGMAAGLPADHVRFEWLRGWVKQRLPNDPMVGELSRQGLIAAYYEIVRNKLGMPSFARAGGFEPSPDHLAIDEDGYILRWDLNTPSFKNPGGLGAWVLVDELPGYRIASGNLRFAPGTWPPLGADF